MPLINHFDTWMKERKTASYVDALVKAYTYLKVRPSGSCLTEARPSTTWNPSVLSVDSVGIEPPYEGSYIRRRPISLTGNDEVFAEYLSFLQGFLIKGGDILDSLDEEKD